MEEISYVPYGGATNQTSVNDSGFHVDIRLPHQEQIPLLTLVLIAIYIVFGVLIGVLNTVTIIAISRSPALKNVTNMFVLSLSCADLLLSPTLIFINFLDMNKMVPVVGMMGTRVVYTLFLSLMFTSSATSLLSILAIAVDRYFAVLHPYSYKQIVTPFRATLVILAIWFYCILLMFTLVAYYISRIPPSVFSTLSLLSVILPLPVYLGAVVSQIVICLIASVILYVRIFFALRKIHKASASIRSRSSGQSDTRESNRTTKTMALVLGALILSWLPYAIISMMTTPRMLHHYNWFINVSNLAILLLYSNSFMNPIIYAARSADFRNAYWSLLCCCKPDNPNTSTNRYLTKTSNTGKNTGGSSAPEKNDKNGNVSPVDV